MEELIDANEITTTKVRSWKWVRVIERILIVMLVIGVVFKLMHWKWADLMQILSFFLLSLIYLALFPILIKAKKTRGIARAFIIISGIVLGITCFALMFKSMMWEGGDLMVLVGYIAVICGLAFHLFQRNGMVTKSSTSKASIRLLFFGILAIALCFVSPRAQFQFNMDNQASNNLLDAFEETYNDPGDEVKRDRYDKLRRQHRDSTTAILNGEEYSLP